MGGGGGGGENKCFCFTKMIHKIDLLELNTSVHFRITLFLFKNILNDTKNENFYSNQTA